MTARPPRTGQPRDPRLDRPFAAVVLDAGVLELPRRGPARQALRRRITELRRLHRHVALVGSGTARFASPGPGPDGWAVLVSAADPPAAVATLAEVGVGPALVLVVTAGAGPAAGPDGPPGTVVVPVADATGLATVLDTVLRRAAHPRVPAVHQDPAWSLAEGQEDPRRDRVREALFALVAGGFGTRGTLEEEPPGCAPLVLAAGVYGGGGPHQHLLALGDWVRCGVDPAPAGARQVLDLRTGVLVREEPAGAGAFRSARFASAAMPGVVALRVEAGSGRLAPGVPPDGAPGPARKRAEGVESLTGAGGKAAAVAVAQSVHSGGGRHLVERLAGLATGPDEGTARRRAAELRELAEQRGFDGLLADHRRAWAERWAAADVAIPYDSEAELAVRFALFQLWSHTARRAELAVGARGLTGPGYAGHVFWDADVFVLPAMVTLDPVAATAMVAYRSHRLAAAALRARDEGRAGARFPWESAADGTDVTPPSGLLAGVPVPILTGPHEEHVSADVAWAADFCARWSGRAGRAGGPEVPIVVETARYWASRVRRDADGSVHLDRVIGPDEYHEDVDDNAFTNGMARWNLRAGADLLGPDHAAEAARWRALADGLVDGYDPATHRHEQFAGYWRLDPLTTADVAPPPVAADLLLGRERVAASQLIKQADVLMLHHLLPDELPPESLAADIDYYEPRTAHGSSLSPAVSAAVLARAGRPDDALGLLRIALRLDLDDLTGMTASGLHLATAGGVWQCVVGGLLGARVRGPVLHLDPHLPAAWGSVTAAFRVLGRQVRVRGDADGVRVWSDGPLPVALAGGPTTRVEPGLEQQLTRKER